MRFFMTSKVPCFALAQSIAIFMAVSANAQGQYKVDNTIENVRDRDVINNPTADDQSNRRRDIKLTAKLRRAVVRPT